jgi:Raf kinase inhibitor-like YbhB/YbcL family protein
VLALAGLAACHGAELIGEDTPLVTLTSSSVVGGEIATRCTCDGNGLSPQLSWGTPPPATRSFAVLAIDRDSPIGFVHWVLYDVPPATRELPEGIPSRPDLVEGSRQGRSDFDSIGYGGPCPPWWGHRYVFVLYALDDVLNLPAGSTRKELERAMVGHILAHGELVGHYSRHRKPQT